MEKILPSVFACKEVDELQKYIDYLLNFKNVFKNFSYTLCYQVLALILPIITVPYITRVLDQQLVGLNSVIQANCSYFELIGMLGISLLGPREIAKCLGDKEKLSNTFFSIYQIQFAMHSIVLIVYGVYAGIFMKQGLAFFYLIYLFAYMFDISWLFIGLEDFKSVTVRNVFIRLVGFSLLITCVKKNSDIYIYVLTLYIPQIIMNVYMWYIALEKYVYYKQIRVLNKFYLKEAISLLIPQIASSVYTMLDKTVLGIFCTYTTAAIYAQGQTLLQLFYAVVPSFCKVMSPRIANCIKRNSQKEIYKYMRMSCHVVSFISCGLFWGVLVCAKTFVGWYLPQDYSQVADVLLICSPIIIMVSGANYISVEYLIPLGEQNKYTKSIIIAAILNLILNFALAPKFGIYGVCVGSVVAETIGFFIQLFYAKQYIDLKRIFAGTQNYLIAGIGMYLVLKKITCYTESSFGGIIILVLIGMIIYTAFVLLCKKTSRLFKYKLKS